ncbi:MAG: HD-GYP domain-containing protein [Planctomycetota bacterium]|jgi:HD-GYP domain-containing protein (c-di-GMP phosphodiesterase class II)
MATPHASEEGQFFPVHLAIMQPGTLAPVDLYMKVRPERGFTLYKTARTRLIDETRQRLLDRGVATLYLRKRDEYAYDEYVEQHLEAIVRDDLLPRQEACQVVYNSSTRVMRDVFQDPRSGKNLQRASLMVRVMVLAIIKDSDALWHMTTLASHDYYTYTHSVQVSTFLVATAKDLLGIDDETMLQRIGYGGMVHDLGKSQIPERILRKPGKLTHQELERVKQHPVLGLQLIEQHRKTPATSAAIVRSHHERIDGKGYPDGMAGEQLRPVVRLAKIIDVYDALTTERPYAPAQRPFDALRLMRKLEGQFDADLLEAFVRFLGPGETGR